MTTLGLFRKPFGNRLILEGLSPAQSLRLSRIGSCQHGMPLIVDVMEPRLAATATRRALCSKLISHALQS